jgi:uncharacterized protein (DUF2336 family)
MAMPAQAAPLGQDEDSPDEAVRMRLAAAPHTAPDTLLALAADPAPTVRAAIAINPAAPPQADRALAADPNPRVRTLLARKLAALIPSLGDPEREQLRQQALAVLADLVEDEAERVRAAIAEVVKDMPSVPHRLILRLAHDSAVTVCGPVIRLSPLLTTQDLLSLVAASPSPYTGTAVARRPCLPEPVSDAIVATAGPTAIAALLANESAAIREATLDALIARAADNASWHAPLVRRPRLSARAAQALSEIVATQLLGELTRRADLAPGVADDLNRRLTTRLRADTAGAEPDPNIAQAMANARLLSGSGALDENALLAAVQRGEARMATALLAVAAGVPAAAVDRAARLRSAKGLVSMVWQAGFTMRAAGPVQMLLGRLGPGGILRATGGGGFPLAAEEMRWQIEFLSQAGR